MRRVIGEFPLAGTTTWAREDVARLVRRYGIAAGRHVQTEATLKSAHRNEPEAFRTLPIVALIDGLTVGALWSEHAQEMQFGREEVITVPAQLHVLASSADGTSFKTRAFVWLGSTKPEWTYTASNPMPPSQPPTEPRRSPPSVSHLLTPDASLTRAIARGKVTGYGPQELIEPIRELKRQQRYREALVLIYTAIGQEEDRARADGSTPAPGFTEQAAIVHRKLKERTEEVSVLRRFLDHVPAERRSRAGRELAVRLARIETIT
ncbi:hypothetical protein LG274_10065 [Micrococcus antarcticus]|uniref:hypothetical protein n=1 Tax=Micrococcus antarcticus TaxID=86171 RepID=UPI00384FE90C